MTLINNTCCLQAVCVLYWIFNKKKKKNKSILSVERAFRCTWMYVSYHHSLCSWTQCWFNPVPQYQNQVFFLRIYPLLTLEDMTELVTDLRYLLVSSRDWTITAFRNLYSCESEMTFSTTDWRLQQGSEADLELWTKLFRFDLLWHLSLRCGSICDVLWQQRSVQLLSQYDTHAS